MTDQTPDPIDVEWTYWKHRSDGWSVDVVDDSGVVCIVPAASRDDLDALNTASRIADLLTRPIVDDATRGEVEALIEAIKAMRPDPSEPCPPGWDADDREGDRNVYRSAELLAAAYLPPPRLTDASYSGRTYK